MGQLNSPASKSGSIFDYCLKSNSVSQLMSINTVLSSHHDDCFWKRR